MSAAYLMLTGKYTAAQPFALIDAADQAFINQWDMTCRGLQPTWAIPRLS